MVIKLNPESAPSYYFRAEAWLHLREWEKARADLIAAMNMRVNIGTSFRNGYESVADFEQEHNVKLPENIAALLTSPQAKE